MVQDDGKLAALLATNIDRHFKQLMLTYQHKLYGFVLRQTGSVQEAEDITQEAFICSYYAFKDYPVQKVRELKLQAWLFKIALNIFYNRQRIHTLQQNRLPTRVEWNETPTIVQCSPTLQIPKRLMRCANISSNGINCRRGCDGMQNPISVISSNSFSCVILMSMRVPLFDGK